MAGLEISLLGPLEVRAEGRLLEISGGRQRVLLAVLALHAGRLVTSDELIAAVWDGDPPPTALYSLRNLVSQLRKTIDPGQSGCIASKERGYVLHVAPSALDVRRFESLASEGHLALDEDVPRARDVLAQALALWRGDAFAGFEHMRFIQTEKARLDDLRAVALHDRIDADLALGRQGELIPELRALVGKHRLDEHHRRQYMLALYRSGRQAEALATYRELHKTLQAELGLEPAPETRRLERAILDHDPALGSAPGFPRAPLRRARWKAAALLGAVALTALVAGVIVSSGGSTPSVVGDSLVKIDPRTNRIVDVIPVGAEPGPLAVVGRYVFVTSAKDGSVSRVDRGSGDIETRGGFSHPRGVVADGPDRVWIVDEGRHEVVRLDAATLSSINRIAVPRAGLGYVAVGGGSLWLNELPPGAVSRWRLDTLRLQRRFSLDLGTYPLEAGFADGAAWFALVDSGELLRVDAKRESLTRTFVGPGLGGPPTSGFGGMWVTTEGGDVWRVDLRTLLPRVVAHVGADAFGVAAGSGSVWAVSLEDGTVSRIDPSSGRVQATVTTGFFPQWLAADERSVWVGVSSERWGFGD